MPLRALFYRRPSEPQTFQVEFGRASFPVRVRRHRQARRYTLRIQAVNGASGSPWSTAKISLVGTEFGRVTIHPNPWRAGRHDALVKDDESARIDGIERRIRTIGFVHDGPQP